MVDGTYSEKTSPKEWVKKTTNWTISEWLGQHKGIWRERDTFIFASCDGAAIDIDSNKKRDGEELLDFQHQLWDSGVENCAVSFFLFYGDCDSELGLSAFSFASYVLRNRNDAIGSFPFYNHYCSMMSLKTQLVGDAHFPLVCDDDDGMVILALQCSPLIRQWPFQTNGERNLFVRHLQHSGFRPSVFSV